MTRRCKLHGSRGRRKGRYLWVLAAQRGPGSGQVPVRTQACKPCPAIGPPLPRSLSGLQALVAGVTRLAARIDSSKH